jgi:hypothetical protein
VTDDEHAKIAGDNTARVYNLTARLTVPARRHNSELRGKPVAVGGSQQRGVVVNFIEGRGAARAATESVLALPRLPCSTGCGETAPAKRLVQPGDQRRQERAQHR